MSKKFYRLSATDEVAQPADVAAAVKEVATGLGDSTTETITEAKAKLESEIASTSTGGVVTDLSSLFSNMNTSLETAVKEIVDDYLDDATTTTYPTSAS